MHMLLKSTEIGFDLGTALLLSLFTRLLLAGGPCCLAAFPGASSEMKAEVSLPVAGLTYQVAENVQGYFISRPIQKRMVGSTRL